VATDDEARLNSIRSQYPPILTTAQVAELLGLNVRTVMVMALDGRLPASRLPGSRKYHFILEDVLTTLAAHRVAPESGAAVVKPEPAAARRKAPAKRATGARKKSAG
jgi:excisionase family DNA binding protein